MMKIRKFGNCTLYQGDCLRVIPTLAVESIDFVITDPPYSSGGMTAAARSQSTQKKYVTSDVQKKCNDFSGDNRDQRGFLIWSTLWMDAAMSILKPGGIFATFTDWRQLPVTTDALQVTGYVWRGVAVWAKKTARPQLGRYTNQCEYVVWGTKGDRKAVGKTGPGVVFASYPAASKRQHITEKPLEVCEWLLAITEEGDTILDPFMGSGSLGVACRQLGRNYIGIEMNDHYFNVACERIKAKVKS